MSVKKKFKGLSDKAVGWLFIGPTVILLLAINIYPLFYAIKMSFTNFYANKIGREPQFIGLKNYNAFGSTVVFFISFLVIKTNKC